MKIKLKAGIKYGLCSCGRSNTLPFCDNAHRKFNEENEVNYKSVKIIPDKDIILSITSSTWELDE